MPFVEVCEKFCLNVALILWICTNHESNRCTGWTEIYINNCIIIIIKMGVNRNPTIEKKHSAHAPALLQQLLTGWYTVAEHAEGFVAVG